MYALQDKTKLFCYKIFNQQEEFLGIIEKKRVGRFMHWTFQPDAVDMIGEIWFTNGCLKEITTFITKLYIEDIKKRGKTNE